MKRRRENSSSLRAGYSRFTRFGYREYARTIYHGDDIVMLERPGRAEEPASAAAAL